MFDVSCESALRAAGYAVTVVPNQGKGAASARIEAARRLMPSIWFDATVPAAGGMLWAGVMSSAMRCGRSGWGGA